jgi:Tfp pilus assembly protein PilV
MVEVLMAAGLIGVISVTLYIAIAQGFAATQVARENLRATQILQEKMETIRLYGWDQINVPG